LLTTRLRQVLEIAEALLNGSLLQCLANLVLPKVANAKQRLIANPVTLLQRSRTATIYQ
jgi:hypothetical protein